MIYSEVVALSEKAVSLVVMEYYEKKLLAKANVIYNLATGKYDICFHPEHTPSFYDVHTKDMVEHCKKRIKVIIEEP